mmetsp:Transcript_52551/g.151491  ORF Transcript_52551/g.151491 Transcript_52551/m.151491 type:complete len:245 (-) Transcript_52551:624-1358(-)
MLLPPLEFRQRLALVYAFQDEALVLHLRASGALLVHAPCATWELVDGVQELQPTDRIPEARVRSDVLDILYVDDLCVDDIDGGLGEPLEHRRRPLECELVGQPRAVIDTPAEHMEPNALRHVDDPEEPPVRGFAARVAGSLQEVRQQLLRFSVALLAEVDVAVLGAMKEELILNALPTVVADLVRPESRATIGHTEGSLLLLHYVRVRNNADPTVVPRQRVRQQWEQRREQHRDAREGLPDVVL